MMKRFYYGAMATGLLFAACSSDNLSEPGKDNGPADADKTLYVKMSLRGDMSGGTRAASDGNPVDGDTDFDKGENESEVNNAYFVFYDEKGNQVGDIVQIVLGDDNLNTEAVNGTVEKYYSSVVSVSIKKGELDPAKVICYINPLSPNSLQSNLSEIQTVTRELVKYDANGKTYFPMSNSVYYENNTSAEPTIAVAVDSEALYDTKEEALGENAQAIDVYVERYASKLKFAASDVTDYTTATANLGSDKSTEVVLTFVPERWALNAEAKETYAVKSFRQASTTGQVLPNNYPFDLLNGRINASSFQFNNGNISVGEALATTNSFQWNNPGYHRSYWAVSPAYFTESYPEVASDVKPEECTQKYYTYNELSKGAGFAANEKTAQYFRETTVGIPALASANPAAATPSVILVGKYTVKVGGGAPVTGVDFYTYLKGENGNPLVFFDNEDGSADSKVDNGVSMLMRFLQQTTILYKKVNGEYVRYNANNEEDLPTLVAALDIVKPEGNVLKVGDSSEAPDLKIAARYRTLQFTNITETSDIYVANGNGYKAIVADDADNFDPNSQIRFTDANRVLMQQVGYASLYNAGAAYFNIPVKHTGWYRNGNAQKNADEIDWSKVRVGDFGLVRNHSYSINVTEISGLATGIGGYDDPIVPPADTKDYYVAYRVNILKWAVVPQQNVELKK